MDKLIASRVEMKKKDTPKIKREFISDIVSIIDPNALVPISDFNDNETLAEQTKLKNQSNGHVILHPEKDTPYSDDENSIPQITYKLDLPNVKKQYSVDSMITKMTSQFNEITNKNKKLWEELRKNIKKSQSDLLNTDYNSYDRDLYDSNDVNLDNTYFSISKNKYFKYLHQRHDDTLYENSKKVIENYIDEQSKVNSDDVVCSICNDGDYEEHDLIVFCSVSFFYF